MGGCITSPTFYCWKKNEKYNYRIHNIDYSYNEVLSRINDYNLMDLYNNGLFRKSKWTKTGWWWDYSHGEFCRYKNKHHPQESSQMGVPGICLRCKATRHHILFTRVVTVLIHRDIPWLITIPYRLSCTGLQHNKWSFLTSISCCVL